MKEVISLSSQEIRRIRVLEQVISGAITLKLASKALGASYRQAKRLKATYVKEGAVGIAHGNRGRKAAHGIDEALKSRVLSFYEKSCPDANDSHCAELLWELEGIRLSRESVRRILRGAGKAAKRSRRPPKHRSRRERKGVAGLMLQWDGSPHRWFGPDRPPCCLMAAVDDATGEIVGALFVEAESSEAYLRLLRMLLLRRGIPASIYHDKHSSLVRSDDHWSLEEQLQGNQYPTHVGRVIEELGIESIPANSPQAKGRIERLFGVLQDRLIVEMRLNGITGIEEANKWLEEVYIDRHNARFAKPAAKKGTAFARISKREVYKAVAFAYEAVVGNDNCVRLGGLIIDIPEGKNGLGYAGKTVLTRQHIDGKWSVWLDGVKIASHPATPFREPVRSWKIRPRKRTSGAKSMVQVYIASKPAPPPRGHNHIAVKGTY